MIDFLLDNWIIIGCFLFGGLLGLFVGKFYKKKNAKLKSDGTEMILMQNWSDIDITD